MSRENTGRETPGTADEPTSETDSDDSAVGLYRTSCSSDRQRELLTSGDIPVAVYGLGKMGLPLAGVYAERFGNVTGVDIDPAVVEQITNGESHIVGEPGLETLIAEQVDSGRLEATTNGQQAASTARVHVIIVPTLLDDDQQPDLTTVESVVDDIAAGLETGDLVVAESTLPPTSCRDVIQPHLEQESGLSGDEFGLAFCPERTSSTTALRDIRGQYPKVVGGIDDESTRAAALLYDELSSNEVHPVSDATTAEAVKVFEGIYRDVNIGLANELGRLADELGISVREAIQTANDLPMCQLHDPGPGVGGHCIPYYPHFLLAQNDEPMAVTQTARQLNDEMPTVVVDRLERVLSAEGTDLEGASVLVLGVTYRPGIEETRASPALGVIDALDERGANVAGIDPLVDPAAHGARALEIDDLSDESFDAAILVTPHDEFDAISWGDLDPMVIVDGRDALDLAETDHQVYTLAGKVNGQSPAGGLPGGGLEFGDERTLTADGGLDDQVSDRPAGNASPADGPTTERRHGGNDV